ncbi:hypothetical protein BJX66DRAFT_343995 [Aspergillus keveii]|uniref:Uncharacterized protein n=1 Tax=Aspergillus keveii TaxID=714993 RepID=A0ABR4FMK1_9EURO
MDISDLLHPESRPAKRARTNTNTNTTGEIHAKTNSSTTNTSNGTSKPATMGMDELRPLIPSLGPEKILALLTQAAESTPSVRTLIQTAITAKRLEESRRVINFDWHSKSIWKEINITYSRLNGSRQYEASGDVYHSVCDSITSIVKQCGPLANPATRYNGLSVLRKIAKTICLSATDVVGHEVQKQFQWANPLDEGMVSILEAMTLQERRAVREDELYEKFSELVRLSVPICILPGLDGVLELLHEAESYDGDVGDGEAEGQGEGQYEDEDEGESEYYDKDDDDPYGYAEGDYSSDYEDDPDGGNYPGLDSCQVPGYDHERSAHY